MMDIGKHDALIDSCNFLKLLVFFIHCFLPTTAVFVLGDWLQISKTEEGYISKTMSKIFIAALALISWINIYYFFVDTFGTIQGKLHMITAIFIILFIVFLLCSQLKDYYVKIGIIISYTGISISFTTLVIVNYFETFEKMSFLFSTGMIVYIFGYILICAKLTASYVYTKILK